MYSWSELCLMLHRRHMGDTVFLKQSSSDNLETYLTSAEIPSWLYDFWDWWIGWFTDIPSTRKDLRKRWDVRLASIAKSLQLLPDFELLGLSTHGILRVLPSKGGKFHSCTCRGFWFWKTQICVFFRCRIRWEFESPVIPLLSKIAPSDVILVRSLPAVQRFWSLGMRKECSIPQRRNHSSHPGYLSKGSRGVACVWTQPWPPGKEAWRNWKYVMIGDRYEPFEGQG